jgi:lipoprotein-anchoring transpeptidase ErfK/SrfK
MLGAGVVPALAYDRYYHKPIWAPARPGDAFPFPEDHPAGQPAYLVRRAPRAAHRQVDAIYIRQVVAYPTHERVGTIIVDTGHKFLYLVLGDGTALRYGIGTARTGFEWSGVHTVTSKREWPDWTPPAEMRRRQPGIPAHMEGGIDNPLGARALYIGSTLYRIHGTNEPWTIGHDVSSGCIRMTNADVIDLYGRARIGAKVVVF